MEVVIMDILLGSFKVFLVPTHVFLVFLVTYVGIKFLGRNIGNFSCLVRVMSTHFGTWFPFKNQYTSKHVLYITYIQRKTTDKEYNIVNSFIWITITVRCSNIKFSLTKVIH